MRIVELMVENIKRVLRVVITPGDKSLVVIGGANGAGKSSLIDAIMYALAGKRSHPDRPVRDGAPGGEVRLDLGDLVVRRTFTPSGGGTLVVSDKEGRRYQSPQAMLDGLYAAVAFDPLAFQRMPPREQAAQLRALVGLDTSDLDAREESLRQERRSMDAQLTAMRSRATALDLSLGASGAAAVPIDLEAIQAQIVGLQDQHRKIAQWRERRSTLVAAVADMTREIAAGNDEIERLKQQIRRIEEHQGKLADTIAKKQEELCAIARTLESTPEPPAAEALLTQLAAARAHNDAVAATRRQVAERDAVYHQLSHTAELLAMKDLDLSEIKRERTDRLAAAAFPVPGLGFGGDVVTYQGVPLAQASSAEQLRVSVAMGLALHPELRVLLIREGSLLDAANLALIGEMAAAADAQVWVERVSHGAEYTVVLEEGMARS